MKKIALPLIFFCVCHVGVLAQLKLNVGYYRSGGTFCSTSIEFYKDSTYFYEHGCEGDSHIAFGKWNTHGDTLFLNPFSNKSYTFIQDITTTKVAGDSIYVKILDKNDKNITGKISMGLYVPGIGTYPFVDNAAGTIKATIKRPNGKLYLKRLAYVFGRAFDFEIADANNFTIKLSIPGELFVYDECEWFNQAPGKYKIGKNTLTNLKYNPNTIVFECQEN